MTNPNLPDGPQVAPPPLEKAAGWPWPQIALLSFNIGLFLSATESLLPFLGMKFPELGKTLSGLFMLAGVIGLVVYWVSRMARKPGGQIAPYSPRMRWLNWGCFAGAVTLTMLSLIIPAVQAAHNVADEKKLKESEMGEDRWETVRSNKGPFVVEIPSGWVEPRFSQDGKDVSRFDVTRIDAINHFEFVMRSIPKADFTLSNLDDWAEVTVRMVTENELEVLERITYSLPGPRAIEVVYESKKENEKFIFLGRFTEAPNHYIYAQATAQSLSEFKVHEETLRRIVRSVRVE